jgi:DMSO/TMAO reductase YedYZ molybdopterin-dependent catalytic subunit
MASLRVKRFAVGVAAGALALVAAAFLRFYAGGPFLPEIASQAFFSVIPGQIESGAVQSLGPFAKYTTYTVAIGANLVIYGLLSLLLFRIKEVQESSRVLRRVVAAVAAYAVILVLSALFLAITRINSQPVSTLSLIVELILPQLIFGYSLPQFVDMYASPMKATSVEPPDITLPVDGRRRLFIIVGALAVAAAALGLYSFGLMSPGVAGSSDTTEFYSKEVTSTKDFYRVDINIFAPSVQSSTWSLSIGGLVDTPTKLTYEQLTSLPSVEQYNTLECVSNEIGGDLMGTARWKGVKLKDILTAAGVQSQANYVVFKCADQYDVGIPLSKGMEDGTLLAYQMNGAPLNTEHGFPLRAIVPGFYGMMNPKWITSIELVDQTYQGFWQRLGWANEAQYNTASSIVNLGRAPIADRFGIASPTQVKLGAPVKVLGVAFAGDRGITGVDVSTDKAATWNAATLKAPLSGNSWVLWSFDWTPPSSGVYNVIVRATDALGNQQLESVATPFPSGATGWHFVTVTVSP